MKLVDARDVATADLDVLDKAVASLAPGGSLASALGQLSDAVRAGSDVVLASTGTFVTPAQAATMLGLSRTHVYKLLDADQIDHVRVGRDRRIPVKSLVEFRESRDSGSKALAERFAARSTLRSAVLASVAARGE